MKLNLLDFIKHELKTPLSSLKLSLSLLRKNPSDSPEKILTCMQEDLASMQAFLQEVLARSLKNKQEFCLKARWLAWEDIFKEALDFLDAPSKEFFQVHQEFSEPVQIFVDPLWFKQALTNLILNAKLHGKKQGVCKIHASLQEGAGFKFVISNHKDESASLNTSQDASHQGQGLKFVRAIILSHGGQVLFFRR